MTEEAYSGDSVDAISNLAELIPYNIPELMIVRIRSQKENSKWEVSVEIRTINMEISKNVISLFNAIIFFLVESSISHRTCKKYFSVQTLGNPCIFPVSFFLVLFVCLDSKWKPPGSWPLLLLIKCLVQSQCSLGSPNNFFNDISILISSNKLLRPFCHSITRHGITISNQIKAMFDNGSITYIQNFNL